jgi:hypothetical protein
MQPEQQQALPRLQSGTTVALRVEPNAMVGELYRGAAWYLSPSQDPTLAELEAAVGQLRLVQGNTQFTAMGSSLTEAGLDKFRVVQVLQPGQAPLPGFSIGVKTLTGKHTVLLVHSQMLVKEMKQLVSDRDGVPPCMQKLI